MNPEQLLHKAKQELFSGWKPFEVFWLSLFIAVQLYAYYADPEPQSPLAMISGIAGVICVVFVSKGKISNYLCLHLFLCGMGSELHRRNEHRTIRLPSGAIYRLFHVESPYATGKKR